VRAKKDTLTLIIRSRHVSRVGKDLRVRVRVRIRVMVRVRVRSRPW
jgi:hypothetical protein